MNPWQDDPESARVTSRQLPVFPRNAGAVCREIELPMAEAAKLHRDGYLSFEPDSSGSLDESCAAELEFLGSLVAGGCSRAMLQLLLRGLRKPYSYDARKVFYDWYQARWRLLPGEKDPEACFFALLERLHDRNAHAALLGIRQWLDEALDLAGDRDQLLTHEMDPSGLHPRVPGSPGGPAR